MKSYPANQSTVAGTSQEDRQSVFERLTSTVTKAAESRRPLRIVGGGTKTFYGRQTSGELLEVSAYRGIIDYQPAELVITAFAGTSLRQIHQTLAQENQMLAFEPPSFGGDCTLGGMVAAGLSGPRRPYAGAVRDAVLGLKIMPSSGETLNFGGQVMKNVAGYDVSRLMTGALGTLGLILEVSLRIAPLPQAESTLVWQLSEAHAHRRMIALAQKPWPLSAIAYDGGLLRVRLSGHTVAVADAEAQLSPDSIETCGYWLELNEQKLAFFQSSQPLWRLSVAPASAIKLAGDWLWDWGGACRWLKTREPTTRIRDAARNAGGHATLFRHSADESPFMPLDAVSLALHQRLKKTFDPHGIFNPGRMYATL